MSQVLVCPLSLVSATVAVSGASHLVSLINDDTPVVRPHTILSGNHLFLGINDITEPMDGMVLPALEHVHDLIRFVEGWDREKPMVVHCYAGISRSTAAAYIALCAVNPQRDEGEIARKMRAASPSAYPNGLLVALGDQILKRDGRMVAAVKAMGRGELASEGMPFAIPIAG